MATPIILRGSKNKPAKKAAKPMPKKSGRKC